MKTHLFGVGEINGDGYLILGSVINAEGKGLQLRAVGTPADIELLTSRLDPIVANFATPKEALPECSLEERYGCSYNPYRKCRDFCRARHVCSQYALARKQIEDLTLNVAPGEALF